MDNPPPNTNINTIVKAQIVFLLSTLTEDNFERNQTEIRSLAEQHGIETYLHFIRRLIVHSAARLAPNANPHSFDPNTALTFRLLVQETQRLARDPFLADRFRDGVDKGEGDAFRSFDLTRYSDRIGLRPLERLVLASAILAVPSRLAQQAHAVVRVEFENAVLALCQHPCFDHADLNQAQTAKLLANLLSDLPNDKPVLDAGQRQALIVAAQAKFGIEAVAPMLQRIFPSISLPSGATLVQTLVQLGPEITADVDTVRALLLRFGVSDVTPPSDALVEEIISSLGRMAAEGAALCDVNALMRALSELQPKIDWPALIRNFDRPDRLGVDTATLKLLIAILIGSPRDAEPHAVTGFWSNWENQLYQLRLLDALLSLPGDTFNFVTLPGRRIVTVDDVAIASPTIKSLAANVQGHTWNSLDLFEVLVRGAGSESNEIRNHVREMLDKAVKISAELVHIGLLAVQQTPWNDIRADYAQRLLNMFLAGHPNHQLVFMRIWQIQPSYLTNAFRDFYKENPLNITRILDVAQDLKVGPRVPPSNGENVNRAFQILDALLEVRPFAFGLDVAALASRREYLNLDKWLADNVTNHGAEFLHAVIEFLEVKMESERQTRMLDAESQTMPLNPQTIAIFLRVLRNNSTVMSEADLDYCVDVRSTCLQIHPRLMNLIPGSDVEPGFAVVTYSAEIEAEVDAIYKQMYDKLISIDDVISLLQRKRKSTNPRDHEIFSCMLHFLFDEYKFFHAYPQQELMMTGYLFGSVIQYQLIDYIPLGIAIRYVFDALTCAPTTNLFKFGIQALSRFESRLSEWQPLCQRLLRLPHLFEAWPELANTIQRAMANADNAEATERRLQPQAPEAPEVFQSIRPDVIAGEAEVPPEDLSDKILFIVNNLAPSNFDAKLAEMKEHFSDAYSRWFAHYLVDQRISTEPNNHGLYLRFLDALDRQPLSKFILHETIVKSAVLLNSEKTIQSSTERGVLKNIASWLGTITLARDRPIRHNNIAFKELLLEATDGSRLVIAIPFVCKTLEPAAKSTIFKPPNPWLMAVLRLLVELYHFAELKLNLKFEIEVLCKALEIDLDSIEPSTFYRNRPTVTAAAEPVMPGYVLDMDHVELGAYDPAQIQADGQVMRLNTVSPGEAQRAVGVHIESILSSLALAVTISPQLAPLNINPSFKRAVQLAVDRAVREIIVPVVERSVTIAGISTRELAAKDFATEQSEDKLRKAGHLMAQRLAGSLALVTCKEPLRSNLGTYIRQLLAEHGFSEQSVPEQVILLLVQGNIDVACQAIEKAAMDRAIADVEESFMPSYESRRRHRSERVGQPFWDPSVLHTNYPASLPEPLRIKATGVTPQQYAVYEDFADPKRRVASRPASTVAYGRNDQLSGAYSPSPLSQSGMMQPSPIKVQDVIERMDYLTRELEAILLQLPTVSLATLPSNHEVRLILRQILSLASESGDHQRVPLAMAQKVVQLLYKTPSPLGREIYVALLGQLCNSFDEVAKEVLPWLIESTDERKFNAPVTVALIRSGLITVAQQDQQAAKLLFTSPRPNVQDYAATLIRECLIADPPVAAQSQFTATIEAMVRLSQAGRATEEVDQLLNDMRGIRRPVVQPDDEQRRALSTKPENDQMREKLMTWFQQWVAIYQRSSTLEKSFVQYITALSKQGILKVEEVSSFFFRVCAEASVGHYMDCVATGDFTFSFQALDAMSRLIVYIIKYHGDPTGVDNEKAKAYYFRKILSIVVLVLANMHEEHGAAFPQKAFFRFFSSLINDLHSLEENLGPTYMPLLLTISETLSSLQPVHFPGFAFSWTSLISHRHFMPKLLGAESREGWSIFHKLILSLLRFLSPFLKTADLQKAPFDLYRGTLRLLLVLLHDFPEFLSEYYFTLVDAIPARCIQIRNIILSAYPSRITLPDPDLHSAALEDIPEMGRVPPILSDTTAAFRDTDIRALLDQVLSQRSTPALLASLKDALVVAPPENSNEVSYNVGLINTVVMYIGTTSVAQAKSAGGATVFVATNPGPVALQYLATNFEPEGQYLLLSAMVIHLRYPNAHTHWFSSMMLDLFLQVKGDRLGEIVTRVLLERFIVHRPHPWGALATFIELLRNPKYDFANQEFTRSSREVTTLLNSVATAVLQP